MRFRTVLVRVNFDWVVRFVGLFRIGCGSRGKARETGVYGCSVYLLANRRVTGEGVVL